MNNILFGLIGILMVAITGLGFAEVKGQMGTRASASPAAESALGATGGNGAEVGGSTSLDDSMQQPGSEPTVSSALTTVARKVVDAVEDATSDLMHEDRDDDGWGERDDEDADDDERHSGTSGSVSAPAPTVAQTQSTPEPNASVTSYTLTDVATHNTAANCWSAINGNVYDLTSFVSQHPGGKSAIKSICGVDGSMAFNGEHGGQSRPANELADFKIGVLQ